MCTRVLYTPKENESYVGRNMDWAYNPFPQLWALPSNVQRRAMAKTSTGEEFTWTSLYSSVVVSNFDCATSDGINEKGLTANLLWLSSSVYPESPTKDGYFPISMSIWAQYVLDVCKTVKEAVISMNNLYVQSAPLPGDGYDEDATCHMSVGDPEGNSAVFEYVEGRLHVYTNVSIDEAAYNHPIHKYTRDQVRVMANDPRFDLQLKALTYWNELNSIYAKGRNPEILPGSNWSLSRFTRATYFTRELPLYAELSKDEQKLFDKPMALARLAAVINNAAQPATSSEGESSADLSRTQYSSFADQTTMEYFYRSAYSPFMVWINLKSINFDELLKEENKGKVFKFPLNVNGVFKQKKKNKEDKMEYGSGNITKYKEITEMFTFLSIE
jgi:choloylglycine hydrolase